MQGLLSLLRQLKKSEGEVRADVLVKLTPFLHSPILAAYAWGPSRVHRRLEDALIWDGRSNP